jgi:hypothetical protein
MTKKSATKKSSNGIPAEPISMKEIEKLYDRQWVVLGEVESDRYSRIKRAKVLWHGKSRDQSDKKAFEFRPKQGAVLYIGEWPKDVGFIL